MASAVSAALPPLKKQNEVVQSFGGMDILRKVLTFLEKGTQIFLTFRGLETDDRVEQLEQHLIHQPVVTLKDIYVWETLKGRSIAEFEPDDPQIAFTKRIRHLDLTPFNEEPAVNDDQAMIYLKRFTELHSLNLGHTQIGNQTVSHLAHNFPDMQRLSLNYCQGITSSTLMQTLLRKHQKLVAVGLSGIDAVGDTAVVMLVRNNPALAHLELEDTSITDNGVLAIRKLENTLTYLNISENAAITDLGVGFALRLPNLKTLLMRDLNETHTPASMEVSLQLATCTQLEEIVFNRDLYTDSVVRQMALKFPHLKDFRMDNDIVTDDTSYLVLQTCHEIATLNLRHYLINDQMIGLITQLPHLASLNLSYNDITLEQVYAILQNPSLEHVTLADTFPQAQLMEHFPHITFEFVTEIFPQEIDAINFQEGIQE
ncbi:MAG TPA: hypothetical protein VLG44_04295 [Chlamydiales bacterium]|nr:hypothetical protein [Chlamydiales bacterium]